MLNNPIGAFSRVSKNYLHVEDIRSYIHYKIESIGDSKIHNDLSLKYEHKYLERLNLVKHMFNKNFDSNEWKIIIHSRVHDDFLWLGDYIICIDNDLIHKVIGLRNEGSNLVNIKNVRKLVEANINTYFDGRSMKLNSIQDDGVKLICKILGYKYIHGSRIDSISIGFLHASYLAVRGEEVNMCDIVRTQLLDNISRIKKSRNVVFRFESLITHIFFYAIKKFPAIIVWNENECTMQQIT